MNEIEIPEMTRDLSREELEGIVIRLSQTNQPSDVSISALLEGVEPLSELPTKEPVDIFGRQVCDCLTRLEGFNSEPYLSKMAEYGQETIEMLGRIVKGVITDVEAGFQRAETNDHDVIELWTNGIAALVHLADALLEYRVLVKYFSRREVVERIADGMMYLMPMVLRLDPATHYSTKLYELWFTTKVLDQEYERLGIDIFKTARERVCEVFDMANVDGETGLAKSRNGSGSTKYMLPTADNVKQLPRDINCPPDVLRPIKSSSSDGRSTETGTYRN